MPSLTITVTTEQAQRVADAYGDKLGLNGPATMADVKSALIAEMKTVVRNYELGRAYRAVTVAPDVEPT